MFHHQAQLLSNCNPFLLAMGRTVFRVGACLATQYLGGNKETDSFHVSHLSILNLDEIVMEKLTQKLSKNPTNNT